MHRGRRGWANYDETTIARLQKEGRGKGTGSAYRPWITVRDISSLGLSSRSKGWTTGRLHHLLSELERHYFYGLDWSTVATDIREQFPLPLESTMRIAAALHIVHPTHPSSRKPVVMTTDFLVTCSLPGVQQHQARTVKYESDLASRRVLEKFEIERVYWEELGVDWGIVTEHEINLTLAHNVEAVHSERYYPSYSPLTSQELSETASYLTRHVVNSCEPLRRITSDCDRTLGLPMGTSLAIAYYLIATRQWLINMYTPIDPTEPLNVQQTHLSPDA